MPLCLLLAALHAAPARYDDFGRLPDKKKERIVLKLYNTGELGKPEHKPIIKDILTTQALYAHANAALYTVLAMDLAERHKWTDLTPLVEGIYQRPRSLALYERAFLWLRGKPPGGGLLSAADALIRSGFHQTKVTDDAVAGAKGRLLEDADKEAVLVLAFKVALSGAGKGGTDKGRRAGIEILRSLDASKVRERISQFKRDFEGSGGRELEQLDRQLGF